MAKDKRLLIVRAVLQHIVRKAGSSPEAAKLGVFLQFIVPPRVLHSVAATVAGGPTVPDGEGAPIAVAKRDDSKGRRRGASVVSGFQGAQAASSSAARNASKPPSAHSSDFGVRLYEFPCPVFAAGGSSCLITAKDVLVDALKINKRYKHFDAVISIHSISRKGGAECLAKATQVAAAFQRFVVDVRVRGDLPRCLATLIVSEASTSLKAVAHAKTVAGGVAGSARLPGSGSTADEFAAAMRPERKSVQLVNLDKTLLAEGEDLPQLLSRASRGQALLVNPADGRCLIRVGHAGMTAGDVVSNITALQSTLRTLFPTLLRSVVEFKITSAASESIRYSATNAAMG